MQNNADISAQAPSSVIIGQHFLFVNHLIFHQMTRLTPPVKIQVSLRNALKRAGLAEKEFMSS